VRIDFKILLLVYKSLNLASLYIKDLLFLDQLSRQLRSSGFDLFYISRTRTKSGEAVFSVYAPQIGNKLTGNCKTAETASTFKIRLKTHLCRVVFETYIKH